MKTRFLMSLLLAFFVSCSSDDSTPTGTNTNQNGEENSSSSKNEDSSKSGDSEGKSGSKESAMKGTLNFPSNKSTSAVDKMYNNWIDRYYVTFNEEIKPEDYDYLNENKLEWLKVSGRIKFDTPSQTVSEGIGYGMLLTVFQEDQKRFDALMNYYLAWRVSVKSESYFMNWKIDGFQSVKGQGSATDADIDIVAALLVAYEKWGDKKYKQYALENASSIYRDEVWSSTKLLIPGDGGLFGTGNVYNISYFSLAALRLLAEYDDNKDHKWKDVLEASIEYMQKVQKAGNGLWPDWSDADGKPTDAGNGATTTRDGAYKYFGLEGVRIPFRLVWDYLWFGDDRVKSMIKTAAEFIYKQVDGNIDKVKSTYIYQGTDTETHGVGGIGFKSAFCSLLMIDSKYASNLSACNTTVLEKALPNDTKYFQPSLQMLYAMLLNGKIARYK